MRKKIIFFSVLGAIVVLIIIILAIISCYNNPQKDSNQSQACFKNYCFSVQLALTDIERSRGLMFKESLAVNQGMLFIFDVEGEYPFWMKNTLIPLDIIWLNQNQKVVFISAQTPPCDQDNCPSINPGQPAKYVLELNGGVAQKIGLTIGDELTFSLPDRFTE